MNPLHASSVFSRLFRLLLPLFVLWCLALISGCGGDSNADIGSSGSVINTNAGGTTPAEEPTIVDAEEPVESSAVMTGVAAVGRALKGYVYIQDAAGTTINVPIDAGGRYAADVTSMQPPFILQAHANDGRVWYSYAPATIPANVSQLTTLVLCLANDKADLDSLFVNWAQQHQSLTEMAVLRAQMIVNLNLGELFNANSLDPTRYNFFTTEFTTDGTGFDAVLDTVGPIDFADGAYQFDNVGYQASFDETPLPDLDPGEFDLLASSLAYNATHIAWLECSGTIVLSCPIGASCTNWTACPIQIDPPDMMSEPLPDLNAGYGVISVDGSSTGSSWQMESQ